MRMKNLIYCLLLLFVVSCSSHESESEALMRQAEELMSEHPDSALRVLNSIGDKWETLAKAERMRYLLLRTEALNKTYAALDTIEYMDEVLDYYKRHGTPHERTRAYYMMGSVYRDQGNSPQALIYFRDAVNQTSEKDKDRDYAMLSRIYIQMALLFDEQRYAQQEAPMWKEAYKYAMLAKDTLVAINALEGQGSVYWVLNEKDSAMMVSMRCIDEYRKIGRNDYAAGKLGIPIHYYLEHDSLPQAKRAIDEYIVHSGLMDEELRPLIRNEFFYFALGLYYEKTGRSDSALYFYRRLLEYDDDVQNIENGYRGLMSVYRRLGVADSVYKYAELFANANDSANRLNSAGEISRTQALYNLNESQQAALDKTIEANRLKDMIYLMAIAFVVIVVAICYYIRYRLRREKEERMRINKEYSDSLLAYVRAQEELASLHSDTASLIREKEREMENLRQALQPYKEELSPERLSKEHSVLALAIVEKMHAHAAKATLPASDEWSELMRAVDVSLPDFFSFICERQDSLNNREQKVCVLTRLNFIPSEIAVLLSLSQQAITNLRTRLNSKLFNEEGARSFSQNICAL